VKISHKTRFGARPVADTFPGCYFLHSRPNTLDFPPPQSVILGGHLYRLEDSVRLTLWILLSSISFSISIPALAQARAAAPTVPPQPHSLDPSPAGADEASDRVARDMARKANQERAAAVKVDTDKLLKLAVELKASVDKSSENVLSLDVIKKAEEIEKLAHSVRDKMKGPN
jgi:hypothetical protein